MIDGTLGAESGKVNKLSFPLGDSVVTSGAVLGAISAMLGCNIVIPHKFPGLIDVQAGVEGVELLAELDAEDSLKSPRLDGLFGSCKSWKLEPVPSP